ncbi:uncharacterized protein LOC124367145 [Homalodisca vitripennis]|uniref:uncharacterized protein LOC124367145 n=1 Tax=Homalodisca vitripennis TaxID=197043 RepID=UPI001EEC04A0|nr:uncharacterized protein LOC124367145 [Homalodisca vitripennis]
MKEDLPAWLDEHFLYLVLQGKELYNGTISIINYSVQPAVAPGNNFASNLYRVNLYYSDESLKNMYLSLIVKVPSTKGFLGEYLEVMDLFGKERKMYDTILPMFKETLRKELGPISLHCPLRKGLVLMDLTEEGYKMCNKWKRLDFPHCKLVIKAIAKYHAASVLCYHNDPKLVESVSKEVVYPDGGPYEKELKVWVETSVENIARKLSKIKDCKLYADYILGKLDKIWKSAKGMCKRKATGLNVLNHGDLWANNVLFKYNSFNEVEDVKFIDFPIARFTSPVLDLMYFLWMSASERVLSDRQEELYNIYLLNLNYHLQQLGCVERMSREELLHDLHSLSDWALLTICLFIPNVMSEPEDFSIEDFSMEDVENGKTSECFQKLLNGKSFTELLPLLVKLFMDWKQSIRQFSNVFSRV